MRRVAGLSAALLLLLTGATGSPLFAMDEDLLRQGELFEENWSGYCLSGGPVPLQTLAVPVSLMECRNGGMGAPTCEIRCNRMFGFYYSDCSVECRDGYYACCNCDNGAICHCYLDHEELCPGWPRN
jgi:hypothetical protein